MRYNCISNPVGMECDYTCMLELPYNTILVSLEFYMGWVEIEPHPKSLAIQIEEALLQGGSAEILERTLAII